MAAGSAHFLSQHVEVVDGDAGKPDLGLDAATKERLAGTLDLIVNSAGLTDFNPDLRDALAINVDAIAYLLDFCGSAIMPLCCTFPRATWSGRATGGSSKNCSPTTRPQSPGLRCRTRVAVARRSDSRDGSASGVPGSAEEIRRQASKSSMRLRI